MEDMLWKIPRVLCNSPLLVYCARCVFLLLVSLFLPIVTNFKWRVVFSRCFQIFHSNFQQKHEKYISKFHYKRATPSLNSLNFQIFLSSIIFKTFYLTFQFLFKNRKEAWKCMNNIIGNLLNLQQAKSNQVKVYYNSWNIQVALFQTSSHLKSFSYEY